MNQLKVGAILSYFSIFINIIIALVYTPIMVRVLGQSEYGLYSLIGAAVGYLSILDMGLGNAIIRYTSRNRALKDNSAESKLNGMFLILYSLIGVVTLIFGTIFYYNTEAIFGHKLTSEEIHKAKIMIMLLAINFALSFPLGVFGSIMQAYERFIAVKIISLCRSLLIPVITLPFLLLGHGSISIVLITVIINILCLLLNMYYCFKHLYTKFTFNKFDKGILIEITGYSFFIFINAVVDKIYWSSDQFILGIVSGTVSVAIYAIAMQFINLYMLFSTSISGMLLPKVSIMVANKVSNNELTSIMVKFGRLQYILMAYILSGFILFGEKFIIIWAGYNYSEAFYVALIIMIPLIIPLIQNIGISILQAKNLHGFRAIVLIFIAILKVLISFKLSKEYGEIGSAISTAASLFLGNVILMNIYYHYKIGLNMIVFWKNIFQLSLPVVIASILGVCMNYLFFQQTILLLGIKIVVYTIFYFVLFWSIGLNSVEKNIFLTLFRKIRKISVITLNKFKYSSKDIKN